MARRWASRGMSGDGGATKTGEQFNIVSPPSHSSCEVGLCGYDVRPNNQIRENQGAARLLCLHFSVHRELDAVDGMQECAEAVVTSSEKVSKWKWMHDSNVQGLDIVYVSHNNQATVRQPLYVAVLTVCSALWTTRSVCMYGV